MKRFMHTKKLLTQRHKGTKNGGPSARGLLNIASWDAVIRMRKRVLCLLSAFQLPSDLLPLVPMRCVGTLL
jgi:hypothetical protein